METGNPSEGEGRERNRCEVSNCSHSFEDSLQYAKHLNDHKILVEKSYKQLKTILEDQNYGTVAPGNLICSSCLKHAVAVSACGNRETSLESLEQHRKECTKRLREIRQKLESMEGSHDGRCEGCEDCIGPRRCSKTHDVSLSDLSCETVLQFLEKKNWQICPYCLRVERENLPYHFIIGHPVIYDIAGKTQTD